MGVRKGGRDRPGPNDRFGNLVFYCDGQEEQKTQVHREVLTSRYELLQSLVKASEEKGGGDGVLSLTIDLALNDQNKADSREVKASMDDLCSFLGLDIEMPKPSLDSEGESDDQGDDVSMGEEKEVLPTSDEDETAEEAEGKKKKLLSNPLAAKMMTNPMAAASKGQTDDEETKADESSKSDEEEGKTDGGGKDLKKISIFKNPLANLTKEDQQSPSRPATPLSGTSTILATPNKSEVEGKTEAKKDEMETESKEKTGEKEESTTNQAKKRALSTDEAPEEASKKPKIGPASKKRPGPASKTAGPSKAGPASSKSPTPKEENTPATPAATEEKKLDSPASTDTNKVGDSTAKKPKPGPASKTNRPGPASKTKPSAVKNTDAPDLYPCQVCGSIFMAEDAKKKCMKKCMSEKYPDSGDESERKKKKHESSKESSSSKKHDSKHDKHGESSSSGNKPGPKSKKPSSTIKEERKKREDRMSSGDESSTKKEKSSSSSHHSKDKDRDKDKKDKKSWRDLKPSERGHFSSLLTSSSDDDGPAFPKKPPSDKPKPKFEVSLGGGGGSNASPKASKSFGSPGQKKPRMSTGPPAPAGACFKCNFCDEVKAGKANIKNHSLNHFKDELYLQLTSGLSCPLCDAPSRDKITLLRHYAFTHNKVNDLLSNPDDLYGTPVTGDAADISPAKVSTGRKLEQVSLDAHLPPPSTGKPGPASSKPGPAGSEKPGPASSKKPGPASSKDKSSSSSSHSSSSKDKSSSSHSSSSSHHHSSSSSSHKSGHSSSKSSSSSHHHSSSHSSSSSSKKPGPASSKAGPSSSKKPSGSSGGSSKTFGDALGATDKFFPSDSSDSDSSKSKKKHNKDENNKENRSGSTDEKKSDAGKHDVKKDESSGKTNGLAADSKTTEDKVSSKPDKTVDPFNVSLNSNSDDAPKDSGDGAKDKAEPNSKALFSSDESETEMLTNVVRRKRSILG